MVEDSLTPDQRLKLECVAQAIQYSATHNRSTLPSPEQIIATAKEFEKYISS